MSALGSTSRYVCRSCRLAALSKSARPFSALPRHAQGQATSQNDQSTHFGFETIDKSSKEARGERPGLGDNCIRWVYRLTKSSRSGLLIGSCFVRSYERLHVAWYSSFMEGSLRSISESRLGDGSRLEHPRHCGRDRGYCLSDAGPRDDDQQRQSDQGHHFRHQPFDAG